MQNYNKKKKEQKASSRNQPPFTDVEED